MPARQLAGTPLFYDSALKGYYSMESGAMDVDSSTNGRTLTNNGTMGETIGQFGNASDTGVGNGSKYFSRADDYTIGGGNITINCWFNAYTATYATDHPSVVYIEDATSQVGYSIFIGSTGISGARVRQLIAWYEVTQTAISTSTWYMATMTYNGTNVEFYLNSVSKGTAASSGDGSGASNDLIAIGRRNSSAYLSAKIDDVSIFNRVLTATEISNLYNGTWANNGFFMAT